MDRSATRFGILGSLDVHGADGPLRLPGARQRIVLAALLLRANQVVPVDDLVDALWHDRPPATARDQVVNVVCALRRHLGAAVPLVTRAPGYLLRISPGQLDLDMFEAYARRAAASSAAGRHQTAVQALRAGLALWRGRALADVPAPFAVLEAQRLAELRMATMEKLVEAEFALGRHSSMIPELTRLVSDHPLRERFRAQLMRALYAAGRTAEALLAYRTGRDLMVEELGLEPGAELRELERAILTETVPAVPAAAADAGEATTALESPAPAPVAVYRTPAQLPRDIADFTGRRAEKREFARLLGVYPARPAAGCGQVVATPVIVVGGRPGVGKSALVVHAAHLVSGHFPDGQLYVELGAGQHPADVLARFLDVLGADVVPVGLDQRAALFRSLTAQRRILVVLDDVTDAAQARPLLPGGPGCAVVITSRRELIGLEGAHRIRLTVPPEEDALQLFAATAGRHRVAAELDAARRIVERCGLLPLAVRIAGIRVAMRPDWFLEDFARRLADPGRRLGELRVGDLDVRAGLAATLHGLSREDAAAAHRLAQLETTDFPMWTAAAALCVTRAEAEELLDRLAQRHVVDYAGFDDGHEPRYRFHGLLWLYLRERLHVRDAVMAAV